MHQKKWISFFFRGMLFIVMLMSIASCGQSAPTISQPTVSSTSAAAAQPVSQSTAQPTIAPPTPTAAPATITIVIPEDPPSFNALISDTGYDALVMNMVLLGMTAVDPSGNVYPVLADGLPTQANGGVVINPTTGTMDVTWKMRKDVLWSDGKPVTADDVLFTYKAMTDPTNGTSFPGSSLLTGVDKIDDYTFVTHFSSVYPGYLTILGGRQIVIWPAHDCDASQGYQNWDCGRRPLSDGPYTLQDWVTGDHLTFVKNPKFFEQGKPQIDTIIVKIVPDTTVRETMMRQGDADILMWATEQNADDLKNDGNVKVSISPTSRFVMRLFLNLAGKGSTNPTKDPNPFFTDVRVRQAIRDAIDVDTITNTVWHGFAKPVWTEFFRQPYACNIPRPTYDPNAAASLLDQAGWVLPANGKDPRECHSCGTAPDYTKLKFELTIYSDYGEPLNLTQQLIAEQLSKVGIEADLTQIQGSVMWADSSNGGTEQTGNFEMDLYDDGYAGTDPTDFMSQYYNSASAVPDQGWNVGRWINPQFDALIKKAYTLNEDDRKAAFCQMAQILDQQLPQILLFSTINADAYSTRLNHVQANVNSVVSWNVADWTVR